MADVWDKRKRSEVMSLIRSHGNKGTELRLIEIFRTHGIKGWRRKQKLPGKPDFVFAKERLCIFVDGCFWHGCAKCYRRPSSNETYWDAKLCAIGNATRKSVGNCEKWDGWCSGSGSTSCLQKMKDESNRGFCDGWNETRCREIRRSRFTQEQGNKR